MQSGDRGLYSSVSWRVGALFFAGALVIVGLRARARDEPPPYVVCIPAPCPGVHLPLAQEPLPAWACGSQFTHYPIPFQPALGVATQWEPARSTWVEPACSQFPIDRRPAVAIQFPTPSGEWTEGQSNHRNLRSWWHSIDAVEDVPLDERAYTGAFEDPFPFTNTPNGIPDQIEFLMWEVDKVYAAGFRRIIFYLPAGVCFGELRFLDGDPQQPYHDGQNQSINQWWTMPPYKRSALSDPYGPLAAWKETRPGMQVELYVGFNLSDSPCAVTTAPNIFEGQVPRVENVLVKVCQGTNCTRVLADRWVTPASGTILGRDFDPRLQSHVDYVLKALLPWRTECTFEVKRFWMDSASANQPPQSSNPRDRKLYGYTELASMPALKAAGIAVGGEAIPLDSSNEDFYDDCALRLGPFMALGQYLDTLTSTGARRFEVWDFWPNRPGQHRREVHYFPDTTANQEMANLIAARDKGMIVSLINPQPHMIERVKRLYSMGWILVADFNGDGQVSIADWNAAQLAIFAPNRPFITYATGDINQDGVVNGLDWDDFRYYYLNAPTTRLDFGEPNTD